MKSRASATKDLSETSGTRGNRKLMRTMNTRLVLDAIRAVDNISQAQLVRQTKLSVGTIVRITSALKRRKLIQEVGPGAARVGRKPTQLSFNADARLVIGATLESDEARIAVLDLNARVLAQSAFSIKPGQGVTAFVATFAEHVSQLLRQHKLARSKIVGVGLSVQGLVDKHTGILRVSKHLGWIDAPLKEQLEKHLKLPVFMESEARAKVIAENRWGAAVGMSDVLLVEVGSGLGVAMLINGRLCRGHGGLSGELGQSVIKNGEASHHLCLEDMASGTALVQAAHPVPAMPQQLDGATLRRSLKELFEAARAGDKKICRLIYKSAEHLALALATQVNVLDPARIILSGSVMDEGADLFVPEVERVVRKYVWQGETRELDIVASPLGSTGSIKGAAELVYDFAFSLNGPLLSSSE